MQKIKTHVYILFFSFLFMAGLFGAGLGIALARTVNIINTENFTEFSTALPTKILDINGELITEFAADEKREIIGLQKLPSHLLDALITREDRIFYRHRGFSAKAIVRAFLGQLAGRSMGGGSTLSQQIAGTLYTDRTEMSIKRKLRELWWAIQLERRYSKNELLDIYLNKIYFGGGTYGVNAASKYYFGHGADSLSPAESAVLVIQLSNPANYNPFDYPNRAMNRQRFVLDEMVHAGYLSQADADSSFDDFWLNFDYTRISSSAYFMRDDKAPWFSEYVRRELSSMLYGSQDIYTGGFTVNTTLNLKHQAAAEDSMNYYIKYANDAYHDSSGARRSGASRLYVPMTELMTLVFNINSLQVSHQRHRARALTEYKKNVNPVVDMMALMLGIENLKLDITNTAYKQSQTDAGRTTVEGTLIAVENETGYITALVGGSKLEEKNQYIRAVQARIQPGSAFKPLYYSAAIDSRKFTAATPIDDSPVVFYNEAGTPYIPENYMGHWRGSVEMWYALATSLNIPSLHILDEIGFDAAINRSVALLGIPAEEVPRRGFDRVYPLGLGTCIVRPIELARAFAIFANQGQEVVPFAIRTVQDRTGRVILNPERDIRLAAQEKGAAAQIISPENAFIMTNLLRGSVRMGTLHTGSEGGRIFDYTDENNQKYRLPAAGKTGTTQNWADAWAVGYTPYLTSVVWFGFDRPGETLGQNLTGAGLSGRAWGRFMRIANRDYPYREFPAAPDGVSQLTVCSVSGKLLTPACEGKATTQYFLRGTVPTEPCDLHVRMAATQNTVIPRLQNEFLQSGVQSSFLIDDSPLTFELPWSEPAATPPAPPATTTRVPAGRTPAGQNADVDNHNYLLDD